MQFLFPNMLYGLLAVSIPVIIHLLNFQKYRKIYFTQTELIADLQQKTRRQSNLRHWIVLLMRMLAIAMLVFAFAHPVMKRDNNAMASSKYISIYVDNSFSMQAEKPEGSLLNEAKMKAMALTDAYEPSTRFQLLSNELKAKQQRWLSREQLITEIEEISYSPRFRSLSEIVNRQQQLINNSEAGAAALFLISDFQEIMFDLDELSLDTTNSYSLLPVKAFEVTNAYVDSVWFESPALFPGQTAKLNIRIQKQGDLDALPLKLFVNEEQRLAATVDFEGENRKTVVLNLNIREKGIHKCRLQISDNSIDFDNEFFFSFTVPDAITVLIINDEPATNKFLNAYFKGDSLVETTFSSLKTIDYQSLKNYSAIILDQLNKIPSGLQLSLQEFLQEGKSLIVFPALDAEKHSYNEFLANIDRVSYGRTTERENRISSIAWESDFFEGIFQSRPKNPDFPVVFRSAELRFDVNSKAEPLIMQSDGNPFLLRTQYGKGGVYLFSVAGKAESSNFVTHSLFSVLYKMVFDGVRNGQLYFNLGEQQIYENNRISLTADQVPRLKSEDGEQEVIPQIIHGQEAMKFLAGTQISNSGLWNLYYDDKLMDALAFNYDGRESDTRLADLSGDIPAQLQLFDKPTDNIAGSIQFDREGRALWPWFLIAALLFLLFEVILLRIWKL